MQSSPVSPVAPRALPLAPDDVLGADMASATVLNMSGSPAFAAYRLPSSVLSNAA